MFDITSTRDFYKNINASSLSEFLLWFKKQIELEQPDHKKRKWNGGFSKKEITLSEEKWGIRFPDIYREFLTILGVDKDSAGKSDFYDWTGDNDRIARALTWPLEGLLFDIEHNDQWWKSWGPRPKTEKARRDKVARLVSSAPALIPIRGHRYLLEYPIKSHCPVLSVYQSDIIIYGADLKKYLLLDFAYTLNINDQNARHNALQGLDTQSIASIPFWGEIMTHYET